ncbi:MAG: alpha/beta fold hydrolase [Candidatus Hodarchaeales archaeon]|jgi:pimeloyl-ACP methyl ester carboxylesterase
MENLRKYGDVPYTIAVIHGGPGAGGEMAPVARELSSFWGVLEPIQTVKSIDGQIRELKTVVEMNGVLPISLIGFSWGAWLSFLFTAKHPELVKKLIIVGSGPFEEKYAVGVEETRLNRLNKEEGIEFKAILKILSNYKAEGQDTALVRLGELTLKTDQYDPIRHTSDKFKSMEFRSDIFQSVWREAVEMRRSGKLIEYGNNIKCPCTAIHGDYDPHPKEGVQKPLMSILKNFRFILIKNCGHKPWIERQARERFFEILETELSI